MSERMTACRRSRWVDYRCAVTTRSRLDQFFAACVKDHVGCMLLLSDAGNGKTALLQRFIQEHRSMVSRSGELIAPIACVTMPTKQRMVDLLVAFLCSRRVPHEKNPSEGMILRIARDVVAVNRVSLVVLDGLVTSSIALDMTCQMELILRFACILQVSVLVTASPQDRRSCLASGLAAQIDMDAVELPRWTCDEDSLAFIREYGCSMPVRQADAFAAREVGEAVFEKSWRTVGSIIDVLAHVGEYLVCHEDVELSPELITHLDIPIVDDARWRQMSI